MLPSLNLIESVHGIDKKPRTAQQWETVSRNNTQRVTQLGANVPLAWVLVHGRDFIPKNAIVAGEDKRRPLFIARTFWEGGVIIGQAGHHLDKGASFAYNGREISVNTFEVLVPLEMKIRYEISNNYNISNIPRICPDGVDFKSLPVDNSLLKRLRSIKFVMVIDDSMSMAGLLWSQARSALSGLVHIIEEDTQTNAIDLCFLNNNTYETNIRSREHIQRLFDSVIPEGSTPTGKKLAEILPKYLSSVESPNSLPVVVVIITDGVPTDEPTSVIVDAARRLDRNGVARNRFGISFVQIGDDQDAAEYLKELDDDIGPEHNCRDIVDTTPYDLTSPEFTRDTLVKCILGSIDPFYDNMPMPTPSTEKFTYTPLIPDAHTLSPQSNYSPIMPALLHMPRAN